MSKSLIKDIFKYAGIVLRRNTLCRLGKHKLVDEVETLALGEKLVRPKCSVYGCGFKDIKRAYVQMPNDGNNGTFIDIPASGGGVNILGRGKGKSYLDCFGPSNGMGKIGQERRDI